MTEKKHVAIKRDEKDHTVWWVIDMNPEGKVINTVRCKGLGEAQREAEKVMGDDFLTNLFDGEVEATQSGNSITLRNSEDQS